MFFSTKFRVLLTSGILGIANALNYGMTTLILILITNFADLSLSQLGTVSLILVFLNTLSYIVEMGYTESVQVYGQTKDHRQLFTPILLKQLKIQVYLLPIVLIFGAFLNLGISTTLLIFVSLIYGMFNTLIGIQQALHRKLKASIYLLSFVVFCLILTYVFLQYFKFDVVTGMLLGFNITILSLVTLNILDLLQSKKLEFGYTVSKEVGDFARNTFWYYIVVLLLTQLDTFFVFFYLGNESLGVYKPVAQLATLLKSIGVILAVPLLINLSKMMSQDGNSKKAIKLILIFVTPLLFLVIGLSVTSVLWGNSLLSLTYSNSDLSFYGSKLLPWLLLANGLEGLVYIFISYFQASKEARVVRNISLFQLALCLLMMSIFTTNILYTAIILCIIQILGFTIYLFIVLNRLLKLRHASSKI